MSRGFDYAANDHVDLPGWCLVRKIIQVNPDRSLESKARDLAEVDKVFSGNDPSLKQYIKALRPHQWTKNFLVLIPALAEYFCYPYREAPVSALIALVSFSLCASGVYVANDMLVSGGRSQPSEKAPSSLCLRCTPARAWHAMHLLFFWSPVSPFQPCCRFGSPSSSPAIF